MCKMFSQLQRCKTPLTTTHLLLSYRGPSLAEFSWSFMSRPGLCLGSLSSLLLHPTSPAFFYGAASLPLSPLARPTSLSLQSPPARLGFHKPIINMYKFNIHPSLALWASAGAAAPPVLTAATAPAMPPTQQQLRCCCCCCGIDDASLPRRRRSARRV